MAGVLDVLQVKKEGVLKFFAAGTQLGGTNLDFQMDRSIRRRKSDRICIISLKRTGEKLLPAACAMVATENPVDVSVTSSRRLTGELCSSLSLPPDLLLFLAVSLLETSLTRSRPPSRRHDFWWLLIPALTTSLSQRLLC